MMKRYAPALAGFLVGAVLTPGQAQEARRVPASAAPPILAADSALAPPLGTRGDPTTCFGGESGPASWGAFTADAEYVLWFLANSKNAVPVASPALVPQGTTPLGDLGDAAHGRNEQPFSGGRFAVGYWLVDDNPWVRGGIRALGVEARFFFVGQRSVDFRNDTSPTLLRPFFDLNDRRESGFVVAQPGVAIGSIVANSRLDNLWGGEANAWANLYHNDPGTTCALNGMVGFRYLSSDHQLQISSVSDYSTNLAGAPTLNPNLAGTSLTILDSFTAHNRFYGGQVGLSAQAWPVPWLMFQAGVKVALGVTAEDVSVAGSQVQTFPNGQAQTFPGGVLALPSNIGHFQKSQFAQVPEAELKVACRVTDHLTLSGGFSALYWSRIAQASAQVDREVDVTQLPNFVPPAGAVGANLGHPAVPFKQSDLWLLGITLGAEVIW
jgi:hypothetical protein